MEIKKDVPTQGKKDDVLTSNAQITRGKNPLTSGLMVLGVAAAVSAGACAGNGSKSNPSIPQLDASSEAGESEAGESEAGESEAGNAIDADRPETVVPPKKVDGSATSVSVDASDLDVSEADSGSVVDGPTSGFDSGVESVYDAASVIDVSTGTADAPVSKDVPSTDVKASIDADSVSGSTCEKITVGTFSGKVNFGQSVPALGYTISFDSITRPDGSTNDVAGFSVGCGTGPKTQVSAVEGGAGTTVVDNDNGKVLTLSVTTAGKGGASFKLSVKNF